MNSVVAARPITAVLPAILYDFALVESVQFHYMPMPPRVAERREATEPVKALVAMAKAQQRPGDSFTEVMMELAARAGLEDVAISLSTFHQPLRLARKSETVAISRIRKQWLERLFQGQNRAEVVVLSSNVLTANGVRHIPMMDFKLDATVENDPVALAVCRRLGGGHLFRSGSSYHFYGNRLLAETELRDWLLRAQLISRYVDTRWITHQMLEQRCALRVSAKQSGGAVPTYMGAFAGWSDVEQHVD